MTDAAVYYLAGPMSGLPQFNFPAFDSATRKLRNNDFNVVSPAELDSDAIREAALASLDGAPMPEHGTWADFLARDVKLIADRVTGIIFLDGWEKSRGARLEAFVGILCGHDFARYVEPGNVERLHPLSVMTKIARATYDEMRSRP